MPAKKYLALDPVSQEPGQVQFTTVSTGAAQGGQPVALMDNGKLDPSLIDGSVFGAPDVEMGVATEALPAGALVNTFADSSVTPTRNGVRLANATAAGFKMTGYVTTSAAAGDVVKVYKTGLNASVSGLSIGQQFLSTTPGQATGVIPTAGISQKVGNASSATTLHVQIGPAYGL